MENYRVYYTEAGNNYNYNGEWYNEDVNADTKEEAVELIKAYIAENGGNAADYIYKTAEFDVKYIVLRGAYDNEHPEDHYYNRKSKREVYNNLQDAFSHARQYNNTKIWRFSFYPDSGDIAEWEEVKIGKMDISHIAVKKYPSNLMLFVEDVNLYVDIDGLEFENDLEIEEFIEEKIDDLELLLVAELTEAAKDKIKEKLSFYLGGQ